MAILETKQLTFTYPDQTNSSLKDISFSVNEGEFIVLCGPSGSGKSTLLRQFKREVTPHGLMSGEIFFRGEPIKEVAPLKLAKEIGMVFQDPENQMVMDRVFEELIFGLENIGITTEEMRKRVAEMVHYFGISHLLNKKIHELSGGQKQTVNLASVLLMEPKLLLLDEPTAQLDPVATKEFIELLKRMNDEFGITVIITEHRLEELLPIADRVIVLEEGQIIQEGSPRNVVSFLKNHKNKRMFSYLPSPSRLYLAYSNDISSEQLPLTVKEGKRWVRNLTIQPSSTVETHVQPRHEILSLKDVDFQYDKHTDKVLDRLSLNVYEGEWLAIVGANGTGKSTLLKVMALLESPQRGSVILNKKKMKKPNPEIIGYLPQNPKLTFIHDTVRAELNDLAVKMKVESIFVKELITYFHLDELLDRHPYDLSGGEMQKVALAGVLLTSPKILLLDEPTKGLDPESKKELGNWLKNLQEQGLTIVMVCHDIEFAATYSTRCAMMFQGNITVSSSAQDFFKGNTFYTTVVSRITRDSNVPEILTVEEAKTRWSQM